MVATRLPGGVLLAQGETVLGQDSFRYSSVLFWIRTQAVLTDRRLAGVRPRMALGVIPTGSESFNYPLGNIAQVQVATSINWLALILGIILVIPRLDPLLAIANAGIELGTLLLLVIGVALISVGVTAKVALTTNAGTHGGVNVDWFQKDRAERLGHRLSQAIAERG